MMTFTARPPAPLSHCDVLDYGGDNDRAPLVVAVELENEPDVFECPAYAPGFYSEQQLKAWAELMACVLLVVRWQREITGNV